MSIVNKGFRGRRAESARELPPGQHLTADFPVLQAGPTPRIDLDDWRFTIRDERRRRTRRGPGPSSSYCPASGSRRHSLRHHVVQAGYQVGRRFSGHTFRIDRHHRRIRTGRFLRRLHHQSSRWPTFSAGRLGSSTRTRAHRLARCTAARHGCWCRTCISGSPRSG